MRFRFHEHCDMMLTAFDGFTYDRSMADRSMAQLYLFDAYERYIVYRA